MHTDFQILFKSQHISTIFDIHAGNLNSILVLTQSVCNYDGRAGVLLHQWVLVAGGRVITPWLPTLGHQLVRQILIYIDYHFLLEWLEICITIWFIFDLLILLHYLDFNMFETSFIAEVCESKILPLEGRRYFALTNFM